MALPALPLAGRAVMLMDDVANTGRTLVQANRATLASGAASVDAVVTHAPFVGDALAQLRSAGVRQVLLKPNLEDSLVECVRDVINPGHTTVQP